jgi:WD40 repeat protein
VALKMYFIAARYDRIDIWDYESKQHRVTLTAPPGGFNPHIYSCSNDERTLAVADQSSRKVIVWDISVIGKCKEICQLSVTSNDQRKYVDLISFMQNSDQLLVGYYNELRLYDVCNGSCLNRISVETVFVHGSLDKVLKCSRNGLLQEWDDTWTEVWRYNLGFEVYGACINRLEDAIAVAAGDYIAVVDLATLTAWKIFAGSASSERLQFSLDGSKLLATVLGSYKTVVLDIVNEALLFEFWSEGYPCFSIDSKCIYGVSSYDGSVFALDVDTGSSLPCPFVRADTLGGGSYGSLTVFSRAEVVLM